MKQYKYEVNFNGNSEIVYCNGLLNALILASAKRIEKGLHIECFYIENLDSGVTTYINSKLKY